MKPLKTSPAVPTSATKEHEKAIQERDSAKTPAQENKALRDELKAEDDGYHGPGDFKSAGVDREDVRAEVSSDLNDNDGE